MTNQNSVPETATNAADEAGLHAAILALNGASEPDATTLTAVLVAFGATIARAIADASVVLRTAEIGCLAEVALDETPALILAELRAIRADLRAIVGGSGSLPVNVSPLADAPSPVLRDWQVEKVVDVLCAAAAEYPDALMDIEARLTAALGVLNRRSLVA